jgi:phospholipid/cholesterol/gamma-HCH transport system substrate-binding protein
VPVTDHRARLGVLLIAATLLAIALAWWRPDPFAHHTTVRALFADAGALAKIGAEVRIAGTPAGRVVARERRGRLALVTMQLDPEAGPVHADATAELRPRLLFEGTAYVDLAPGSPESPGLGNAAIPASHTRSAVSMADALSVLDRPTRAALRTDAHELRGAIDAPAAQDVLRALPGLTHAAARAATAARGANGDGLARAVRGFSRVARAVDARRAELVPLAGAAAAAARAADRPALDRALAGLPVTVADVRAGGDAASGILDRLDPLARELVPAARAVDPTLRALRPVLRSAAPVLRDARPLAGDARATLGAGASAAPAAQDALRAVDGATGVFAGGLLAALERRTALGTPAYLAFLGLFAGGGGASRPFDPSGAGHFMRFGFRFLTGAGRPAPPCDLLARAAPSLVDPLATAGACQR